MYSRYKNKDKRKEYLRNWRLKNRKRLYAYHTSYMEEYGHKYYKPYNPDDPDYFFYNSSLRGKGTLSRNSKSVLDVIERDGERCKRCGRINDLTIHHLDRNGRNLLERGMKPNHHPNNLIILCRGCHGSLHGKQHGKQQ